MNIYSIENTIKSLDNKELNEILRFCSVKIKEHKEDSILLHAYSNIHKKLKHEKTRRIK